MRVAFLSSEVSPFAKTGGLADVAGALPIFLSKLNIEIRLIMPFYQNVQEKDLRLTKIINKQAIYWKGKKENFSTWEHRKKSVPIYFIENRKYFDRDSLYGTAKGDYPDNGERFAFFSKACLETLKTIGFSPHILHCHDWQTAITLAYLKFTYSDDVFFKGVRSLFTIHNLAYQGIFEKEILSTIGLPDYLFNMTNLEFFGKVNFLKAGILYSTAVSTVSPRYSKEIQIPEYGYGLDGLVKAKNKILYGILNGADYSSWNPSTDKLITSNYSQEDFSGKKECKNALLKSFSLPVLKKDMPVIGMVSRLSNQKGFDILYESLEDLFRMEVYLIILGTGEEKFHHILSSAEKKYPSSLGLKIAFDEKLAHRIVAGSDIFLIPSRYEPCGLTQMYSLKYGTIPVVRATGGLDDAIEIFDSAKKTGNGFKFRDYSSKALLSSLKEAVSIYHEKEKWQVLMRNAMGYDFSWGKSAQEYLKLYKKIYLSEKLNNSKNF